MELRKKFLLALFVCLVFCSDVFAAEERRIVRVGISNQAFSTYEHSQADFVSTGEVLVTDISSAVKLPRGTVISVSTAEGGFTVKGDNKTVINNSSGPVVLTSNGQIGIVNLNRKGSPALYNGQFELKMTKNYNFNIINVLDMQSYLKGVVPNEMPVSFGLEALKAQAVAARNYANRSQSNGNFYDICDSTACQVYYGANSYTPLSNQAVDETTGIMALYKLEPILALYSSTGGGITESYENTFGQNSGFTPPTVLPYLKSVSDNKNYTTLKTENEVREFYSKPVETYDVKSPRYRWKVEWSPTELETILNKTLLEQSSRGLVEPVFDRNSVLEGLEEIKVLKRGDSGKALLVEVVSRTGRWCVKKELGIRRVFQKDNRILYSANFFVDIENNAQQTDLEKAIFDTGGGLTKIVFTGGGYGHGVGMSQYGAGFMASKGAKYTDILSHYYTGITVGTVPLTVSSNAQNYRMVFSAEHGYKYFLKFDNTRRLSKFEFNVNSTPFAPDMSVFGGKVLYFDITKYLKTGINEIELSPLSARDRGKNMRVWVEVVKDSKNGKK